VRAAAAAAPASSALRCARRGRRSAQEATRERALGRRRSAPPPSPRPARLCAPRARSRARARAACGDAARERGAGEARRGKHRAAGAPVESRAPLAQLFRRGVARLIQRRQLEGVHAAAQRGQLVAAYGAQAAAARVGRRCCVCRLKRGHRLRKRSLPRLHGGEASERRAGAVAQAKRRTSRPFSASSNDGASIAARRNAEPPRTGLRASPTPAAARSSRPGSAQEVWILYRTG